MHSHDDPLDSLGYTHTITRLGVVISEVLAGAGRTRGWASASSSTAKWERRGVPGDL